MTQESLSLRLGLTTQSLHRILDGKQPITPETAGKMEMVFGLPASFWNNRQVRYDESLVKQAERTRLEEERRRNKDWIKRFPLALMRKRGYIPKSRDETETYRGLLSFFGIASKEALERTCDCPEVAARRTVKFKTDKWHMAVWIRQGERDAAAIAADGYNVENFKKALDDIRKLTVESPESFLPKMRNSCAKAGVCLALVPEIPKVPWNGATKWMKGKPLIVLNLRGRGEDIFWFSFFHEAAHVLYDDRKQLHVAGKPDDPIEKKADGFAAETLVPCRNDSRISNARTSEEIRAIAYDLKISPGIVAGRYRHLTRKWDHHADLIRKFKWSEDANI
jgi:plasmid maintenance system antidote protein VapI/Zn-dependent peptidase ImmA (M78 family)